MAVSNGALLCNLVLLRRRLLAKLIGDYKGVVMDTVVYLWIMVTIAN